MHTTTVEAVSQPRINGNLDTNFLKLVAIISMFCDHFGKILLPDVWILPVIGRLAFPIFAYCLVVGSLYTSNIKRYILRLIIFALISQPFYVLAFHPTWADFWLNLTNLNIFFTLVVGLIAVYALHHTINQSPGRERNLMLALFIVMLVIAAMVNLDYGINGILLMVLIYLTRERRGLAALLVGIYLVTPLFTALTQGNTIIHQPGLQGFSVLALPLLYLDTHVYPKIPKMFFYCFYPGHLLLIFILRLFFN